MNEHLNRIGVLTGGGDCPGLNAVIRAVVKTAINEYGWEVLGIEDGFEGLIQPGKVRPLFFADVRVTVLGHLQRGGSPTAFDRLLGTRFGAAAAHLIAEGNLNHMVSLENDTIVSVPLEEVVGKQKFVPLDSDLIRTALDLDLCLGNTREFIHNHSAGS